MEPLTEHSGTALVLRRGDVDTDQIIPAEFCKRLTKSGYEDTLFHAWMQDPEFVFNDPARRQASVLVAGHNFGTGSSREHAVWALRDWGIRVVIGTSFGDIFFRNAWKNGVLAVQLPESVVDTLASKVDADPSFVVTVDVEACEVRASGLTHGFQIDKRPRWLLLNGLDDIAVTLGRDELITGFEAGRKPWLPRVGAA
ncbi:3-isopropylmalate dehydratase small subunit [Pseudonocardiaceae bacterium YIM PH 21723]|nr:3-isopropylmalate dehydratase small subunit [Pseudonocardiaceae bacterium YIM PH 21723]